MPITSRPAPAATQRSAAVRSSFHGAAPGQLVVVTSGMSPSAAQYGRAERQVNLTGGAFVRANVLELRALARHLDAQADWLEASK